MRLSIPKEEDLDGPQKALRDAVLGSRKGLGSEVWGRGPFGVWQNAPNAVSYTHLTLPTIYSV